MGCPQSVLGESSSTSPKGIIVAHVYFKPDLNLPSKPFTASIVGRRDHEEQGQPPMHAYHFTRTVSRLFLYLQIVNSSIVLNF